MWDFTSMLCSHHRCLHYAFFSNYLILTLCTISQTACLFSKNIFIIQFIIYIYFLSTNLGFCGLPELLVNSALVVIHSNHPQIQDLCSCLCDLLKDRVHILTHNSHMSVCMLKVTGHCNHSSSPCQPWRDLFLTWLQFKHPFALSDWKLQTPFSHKPETCKLAGLQVSCCIMAVFKLIYFKLLNYFKQKKVMTLCIRSFTESIITVCFVLILRTGHTLTWTYVAHSSLCTFSHNDIKSLS